MFFPGFSRLFLKIPGGKSGLFEREDDEIVLAILGELSIMHVSLRKEKETQVR